MTVKESHLKGVMCVFVSAFISLCFWISFISLCVFVSHLYLCVFLYLIYISVCLVSHSEYQSFNCLYQVLSCAAPSGVSDSFQIKQEYNQTAETFGLQSEFISTFIQTDK